MFSSEDYKIYEHEGMVCITVTHDKPALFNTFVQLVETRGTATSKLCNHCVHLEYSSRPGLQKNACNALCLEKF